MDVAAAAFFAGHGEAPTARFYPVSHTAQTVAAGDGLADIKTIAVVMNFNADRAVHILQADDDLSRVGVFADRKSTRLNSSHLRLSRMPSSA